MKLIETKIKDLVVIEPNVFEDSRGYFFESFNSSNFSTMNINSLFVQDNQSKSSYGVIRGLHFQKGSYEQAKLVRVLKGIIYDVAVDIRPDSPTYGEWFGVELSSENYKQMFVPRGFAHGFSVLSEEAIVLYKCDNVYNKESEGGIIYNDKTLKIDWKIPKEKEIISDKDKIQPFLNENSSS